MMRFHSSLMTIKSAQSSCAHLFAIMLIVCYMVLLAHTTDCGIVMGADWLTEWRRLNGDHWQLCWPISTDQAERNDQWCNNKWWRQTTSLLWSMRSAHAVGFSDWHAVGRPPTGIGGVTIEALRLVPPRIFRVAQKVPGIFSIIPWLKLIPFS